MKFFYLVALLAFIQLVTCDSYLFQFKSHKDAVACMDKNYLYINKVTNENVVLGPVIYMNLKNNCSDSIGENMKAVCGPQKYQHCFQG